jgi:rhomboid protease GluP
MQAAEMHRQHLIRLIQRPPVATYSLLGVITLVYAGLLYANSLFMGGFTAQPGLMLLHGATWSEPVRDHGEYYRLVSAIFVHANLIHLLLNGYGLHILGPALEKFYGWQKFLIIFVFSGLGGTAATLFFGNVPSVGASGAIFGIIGGTGVLGLKYRKLLPKEIASRMTRGAVILFVANVAIGMMVPNIDMAAHLGGAAAGVAITFVVPSDIIRRKNRVVLRTLVVLVFAGVSVWGIYGMAKKTVECGGSLAQMDACYAEQLPEAVQRPPESSAQ